MTIQLGDEKLNVFCGWGDGPDVGINITRSDNSLKHWKGRLFPLDLTASQAMILADALISCARQAMELEAFGEVDERVLDSLL